MNGAIVLLFPVRFAVKIFRNLVRIAGDFARFACRCRTSRRTPFAPLFDALEHRRPLSLALLLLPLSFTDAGCLPLVCTLPNRRRLSCDGNCRFGGRLLGGVRP